MQAAQVIDKSHSPRAHAARSAERPWDGWLLLAVCALLGIGVVMVYSSSAITAAWSLGDSAYYLKRQLLYMFLGFFSLAAGLKLDYRWYQRLVYPILLVTVALLVVVALWGTTVGGATRWIRIGFFNFQPAEIAKISMVMVLAYSVAKKQDRITSFTVGLVPHFIIVGFVIGLLLLQPDFGTSIIIAALMFVILFVAGTRVSYILAAIVLGGLGAWQLIVNSEYRLKRVMAFLDPWSYQGDIAYQVTESMISIGSGGLTGQGLGEGLGKLGFVPEFHTDFIGSAISEEFGFLGVLGLLVLYGIIVWRGILIAMRAHDGFGRYVALGLTTLIGMQASINLGVISGLLPTKGLTLPFVSFGGSSMICSMFAVGVLLNISRCAGDAYALRSEQKQSQRAQERWEKKRQRIMERRKQERDSR